MKKFDFGKEVNELSMTFNFLEKRIEKYYFLLENVPSNDESYIFLRNLTYFDTILEKVKTNFREIQLIKRIVNKKNLKKEIKSKLKKNAIDKAKSSTYLLKFLIYLLKKYSIDKYDYEVQSIVDNKEEDIIQMVPDKYHKIVIEDFQDINNTTNDKLIEHLDIQKEAKKMAKTISDPIIKAAKKLADPVIKKLNEAADWAKKQMNKVTDAINSVVSKIKEMFNNVWSSLKSILKTVEDIGTFIGKTLIKFINLLWELAKFIYKLITEYIPKFIERFFSFWGLLYKKMKKTGLITIVMFFSFNIIITKYWDLLLDDGDGESMLSVPSMLISHPSLFFTTYVFWLKTKTLHEYQESLINFISEKGINLIGFFVLEILNLPNDEAFSEKKMSIKKRFKLLVLYFSKYLDSIIYKTFIFLFILKFVLKMTITDLFSDALINFKDIFLFPVIIIKFIIEFVINLLFNIIFTLR